MASSVVYPFIGIRVFSHVLSGTFRHIPIHLWPVAVILVVVMGLVLRGYRLGLGFGLISIGPAVDRRENPSISNHDGNARPAIVQVCHFWCLHFF
jgi:hypothetical protein